MAKTYTGSYETSYSNFGVRLSYAAAKENGAWYAWITRVEVKMALRTGTYSVNSFGDVLIGSSTSVGVTVIGTTVAGQTYATVWEGTGAKVPATKSGKTLSFTLSFKKNSDYGSDDQMWFYAKAGSTVIQNGVGLTNAAQTLTVQSDTVMIYIDGVLTPATPYIGKKPAEPYLGKVPLGG